MIAKRLCSISANKYIFEEHKREYENALKKIGYKETLSYEIPVQENDNRKKRKRNILWFAPHYNINVQTRSCELSTPSVLPSTSGPAGLFSNSTVCGEENYHYRMVGKLIYKVYKSSARVHICTLYRVQGEHRLIEGDQHLCCEVTGSLHSRIIWIV